MDRDALIDLAADLIPMEFKHREILPEKEKETANLLYVKMKDNDNWGYIYYEFICPDCLDFITEGCSHLQIVEKRIATRRVLSGFYPPLVDEPRCEHCGLYYKWHKTKCDGRGVRLSTEREISGRFRQLFKEV